MTQALFVPLVMIVSATALAGCLDGDPSAGASGAAIAAPSDSEADGSNQVAPGEPPETDEPAEPAPSFEPVEFTIEVLFAVMGPNFFYGTMEEMMREVALPEGANAVNVSAWWDALLPTAEQQNCMVHAGTVAEMGEMLTGVAGRSPLQTLTVRVPNGTTSVVVMCVLHGETAAAEAVQTIRGRVSFSAVPEERPA